MRVLFDAYWWDDGPPSGRMVVRELIRAWSEHFPQDSLTALIRQGSPTFGMPSGVRTVPTSLRPHGISLSRIGPLAKKLDADAIVTQNFAVPGKNSCVFLHDALFQSNPEYFTQLERAYLSLIPLSLPRARHIFTSSSTEASRILKHNDKIREVIPVGLGVGTDLTKAIPQIPHLLESAQNPRRFALAVGRLNVRKNLGRVLESVRISTSISKDCPLVVVGESDGKIEDFSLEVQGLISDGVVLFVGSVTDSELRWFYEKASVLIFASLDEGFGLPPLEAHHFGCPVVLSNIPVFRELYSEIAEFVDPRAPKDIARGIDEVLNRPTRWTPALRRSFSWESVVHSMRDRILNGDQNYVS